MLVAHVLNNPRNVVTTVTLPNWSELVPHIGLPLSALKFRLSGPGKRWLALVLEEVMIPYPASS